MPYFEDISMENCRTNCSEFREAGCRRSKLARRKETLLGSLILQPADALRLSGQWIDDEANVLSRDYWPHPRASGSPEVESGERKQTAIWLWWTSDSPNSEKVKIRQQTDQMLKHQEVQKELQREANTIH